MNRHPARVIPYDELHSNLKSMVEQGLVRIAGNTAHEGLAIYCYTEACTYDKQWNETTLLARGLILDQINKQVVATPFPKFFNLGEHQIDNIPALSFETYEKLDGSLIIVFHHKGEWKTATKGSLGSDQAKWAKAWLDANPNPHLEPGTTYLFEAIYAENRIVVRYDYQGLVLLSAYNTAGEELDEHHLSQVGKHGNYRLAKRFHHHSIMSLLDTAKTLPPSEEGFVLRFSNGLRLKIKGDEYCRIHRLVSRVTPLAMWEAMWAGDDLEEIRKQLPEEFWQDFDNIISILKNHLDHVVFDVEYWYRRYRDLSDKELGLKLHEIPEHRRSFMFPYRRNKGNLFEGKARDHLFKTIRPTGNRLTGYTPSTAMNRISEEAV